jgi:hypothetical protein
VVENDLGNGRLRIRHGIQRLASPSTRVEDVQKDEFVLFFSANECSSVIILPRDHRRLIRGLARRVFYRRINDWTAAAACAAPTNSVNAIVSAVMLRL